MQPPSLRLRRCRNNVAKRLVVLSFRHTIQIPSLLGTSTSTLSVGRVVSCRLLVLSSVRVIVSGCDLVSGCDCLCVSLHRLCRGAVSCRIHSGERESSGAM